MRLDSGIEIRNYEVGPLANNAYLLVNKKTKEAAVVDPSMESGALLEDIAREELKILWILNTHGHFDHSFEDARFVDATEGSLLVHKEDRWLIEALADQTAMFGFEPPEVPQVDRWVDDGEELTLGPARFKIIHTPGHTAGGLCLAGEGVIFSGDTLFKGTIGRTDLPGGSYDSLIRSVRKKLFSLPDDAVVLPGHGERTSIMAEKNSNPFVGDGAPS